MKIYIGSRQIGTKKQGTRKSIEHFCTLIEGEPHAELADKSVLALFLEKLTGLNQAELVEAITNNLPEGSPLREVMGDVGISQEIEVLRGGSAQTNKVIFYDPARDNSDVEVYKKFEPETTILEGYLGYKNVDEPYDTIPPKEALRQVISALLQWRDDVAPSARSIAETPSFLSAIARIKRDKEGADTLTGFISDTEGGFGNGLRDFYGIFGKNLDGTERETTPAPEVTDTREANRPKRIPPPLELS